MAAGPDFIHLNCHSAYSLLEGALPADTLISLAAADAMPAVGVTDTANLFGALEFSEKAAKAGIQPIIGWFLRREKGGAGEAMAAGPDFIHLNCHSAYSLLEGALPADTLISLAAADAMPAVGVTDTANLFGALEFSEKAAKAGIQPIIGCKLPVRFEPEDGDATGARTHLRGGRGAGRSETGRGPAARSDAPLFLLAAGDEGFAGLVRLVTHFYLGAESDPESSEGRAEPIALDRLSADADGLIALTGGHDGPLYPFLAAGEDERAEARLAALKEIFGDRLYVSVERHGMVVEKAGEAKLLALAYGHKLPLVATNEPMFPGPDDFEAHDALLAISDGRLLSEDDRRRLTPDHGFRSQSAAESVRSF